MNHCRINHLFYPLGGLDASCTWKMVKLMGTFSDRRTGWPGLPVIATIAVIIEYRSTSLKIWKSKSLLVGRYCDRDVLSQKAACSAHVFANVVQGISGQFGCAACVGCGADLELKVPRL